MSIPKYLFALGQMPADEKGRAPPTVFVLANDGVTVLARIPYEAAAEALLQAFPPNNTPNNA